MCCDTNTNLIVCREVRRRLYDPFNSPRLHIHHNYLPSQRSEDPLAGERADGRGDRISAYSCNRVLGYDICRSEINCFDEVRAAYDPDDIAREALISCGGQIPARNYKEPHNRNSEVKIDGDFALPTAGIPDLAMTVARGGDDPRCVVGGREGLPGDADDIPSVAVQRLKGLGAAE